MRRDFRVPDRRYPRRDVDDELRFHLEERIDELLAQGMSREEAEAEVRRRFGDPERIGRELERIDRAGRRRRSAAERATGLVKGVRHALRGMAARPGHSAAVVLTLALAIGANTAIFSAVRAVLLRPLPVPGLERLVAIQWDIPAMSAGPVALSAGEVNDLSARADLFAAVTGFTPSNMTLTGTGEARRVAVSNTMGDFAAVFGVRPLLGRFYGPEASTPGEEEVVVIGHALWQEATGGDPTIVGRTLALNDRSFQVVGVMPPGFRYPPEVQVWRPYPLTEVTLSPERRGTLIMMAVARPADGLSPAVLAEQLGAEVTRWVGTHGGFYGNEQVRLASVPFVDFLAGELRPVLMVLLGAVAFVLLIACANVASLQLVRATGRTREVAVRLAMGARRGAIVRQFLLESLLFAALGGAVGLAIGWSVLQVLAGWDAAQHELLRGVRLDGPVLAFTAAVTLLAGLVFGAAPAWRASRVSPQTALKEGGERGGSVGGGRQRLLAGAVVAQLALTLVLLVGSGVMVRSVAGLLALDPGFEASGVVTLQLTPPSSRYPFEDRRQLYDRIVERVSALPGVEAAALTGTIPFSDMILDSSPFSIVGAAPEGADSVLHATAIPVTPDFFRAMGIPLLRGRTFLEGEGGFEEPVAIVDEQFARQYFPGEDAVGHRINHYGYEEALIVGVAASVNQEELGAAYKANVYYPYRQLSFPWAGVVVRSALPPAQVVTMLRSVLREVDPELPVYDVRTLGQRVARSVGDRSLAAMVLGGFAGLALVLAILGTYGVLSYNASQRTRELGIRMALGARPGDVVAMVVRSGVVLASAGLGIGVAVYLSVGRVLESIVHGVSPRDPLSIASGLLVLLAAALVACWVPARRAAREDPVSALRGD